jgi:thioredoxin-related protein
LFDVQEVANRYNVQGTPTFFFIRYTVTLESFWGAYPDKLRDTVKFFIDNPLASASSA